MLGSGAIIVVDDSTPVLDVALKVAKFYRHESCGKCTPCREGTNWTVRMLERIESGEATPMDLDILASVQEHIIGNCLCVLGDAMAMPIGSMIAKFRDEFEEHMQLARSSRTWPPDAAAAAAATITLTIDGREVQAPENIDARRRRQARRRRDPGLLLRAQARQPVGACRMCLVEIEGIPKLQTACSTRGQGRHGRAHPARARWGAARGPRVPARQPPARLPGLRQGRRVPAAGHHVRLGRRPSRASSSPSATSASRSRSRR